MKTEEVDRLVEEMSERAKAFGIIETPFGAALPRDGAGRFLRAAFGTGSPALLAKLALTEGAGPAYRLSGNRSIYPLRELVVWGLSRFSDPRTSSGAKSEAA